MNETTTKATVAQRMRVLQKDISETTSATLPKKNQPSTSTATTNAVTGSNGNRPSDDNGEIFRPNNSKVRRKSRSSGGDSNAIGAAADANGTGGNPNVVARKPCKPKLKLKRKKEKEDNCARQFKLMQEEVNNGLQSCEPGKELEVLHRCLRPDHHLLWYKCIEVKKDLVNTLFRLYPMVRLEVFGSTVMGMAFKDSDFDLYIEVSPNAADVNPAKVIRESMRILGRSGLFTNFTPITQARVPILKCYHTQTGYPCDLNFSDSLGVLNSPILGHLITYDSRIYVLATILKYWMKVHGCSGTNRITNYAVLWMLIFYLQSISDPIVPPVSAFQRNVHEYIVQSFNFAFDFNYRHVSQNRQRASELLLGFFRFYKDFDFETQLICPLHGRSFLKNDVTTKHLPEFKQYEDILRNNRNESPMQMKKPICIQDPFDLTHTIPGGIAQNVFQRIQAKISCASELIEKELSSTGESTDLLLKLFDPVRFDTYADATLEHTKKKNTGATNHAKIERRSSNALNISYVPTEAELCNLRDILTKSKTKKDSTLIDRIAVSKLWTENAIKYIVEMLEEIFMVELRTTKEASGESNETVVTASKTILGNGSDKFLKKFEIVSKSDVLIGRKLVKNIDEHTLKKEIDLSRKMAVKGVKMTLHAHLKISADLENFSRFDLELNDLIKTKKNNHFKTFCTYFQHHSRQFLEAYFAQTRTICEPQ